MLIKKLVEKRRRSQKAVKTGNWAIQWGRPGEVKGVELRNPSWIKKDTKKKLGLFEEKNARGTGAKGRRDNVRPTRSGFGSKVREKGSLLNRPGPVGVQKAHGVTIFQLARRAGKPGEIKG